MTDKSTATSNTPRRWRRNDRVINPLGQIGTVLRRVSGRSVLVEYDHRAYTLRQRGIAYDNVLAQPWQEHDPSLGRGYFKRLEAAQ